MMRTALCTLLLAIGLVGLANCSSNNTTTTPPPISVAISQFPPATMPVNGTALVAATVANDTAGVNWSCTPVGSCGTFSPTGTASGATTTYTAPSTAQMVTITAKSATDSSANASTNVNVTVNFTFYLSGSESGTLTDTTGPNFYGVAGAVTVDADGNVLAGEQDYNDADGITSTPGPDSVTGGLLSVDAVSGQGTLTLVTSNPSVGVAGTETLGVQFVNPNHALIIQFDGSATSSGSMDFQTIPSAVSGSFAFAISGVNTSYVLETRSVSNSVVSGGVFTTDGVNVTNGQVDVNDGGTVTSQGVGFTGALTGPDAFGRGTFAGTFTPDSFVFYVVGPEAVRIIDVDAGDSAVGSAYGQGNSSGGFSATSIGQSVFNLQSNALGFNYSAAGMITPNTGAGTQMGVADVDEEGMVASASAISGTYSIAGNGYGSLTITNAGAEDISNIGMYMTDPNLNLLDPNNTTSGLGGALLVDLDTAVNGTGVLLPQTDIVAADFEGDYAFGAQLFDGGIAAVGWETDFVGNGTLTAGALAGTGLDSDPFFTLTDTGENTGVTITGTAVPDGVNPGRYTMSDFTAVIGSPSFNVPVAIYQASGNQLLWIDDGNFSTFGGSLQQEPQAGADVVKNKAKPSVKKKK
jgi:hypothetical protein